MIRRALRRWRLRNADSGEICHDPDCLRDLRNRDCWETRHVQPPRPEIAAWGGGTYLVGYWCKRHKPADAVRSRP